MSEGIGTMSTTYEISGIPWLAVRAGRALERWGSRAARPMSREDLVERRARQLVYDEAVEARRSHMTGTYPLLK
jgi:hypothetical protein